MNIFSDLDYIYDYEQVLLGVESSFKVAFKKDDSLIANQKAAAVMWKYAIEVLLKWTPEQAIERFNYELISKLKLDVVSRNIGVEFSKKKAINITKVLQYAYPHINYDPEAEAIDYFKRINGLDEFEHADTSNVTRFPNAYFNAKSGDGAIKAAAVINYAISVYMNDKNVYELYNFFAKASKSDKWMRDKGMAMILQQYSKKPLGCLHNALPSRKRNDIFYLNECLRYEPAFKELRSLIEKRQSDSFNSYYKALERNRQKALQEFESGGCDEI